MNKTIIQSLLSNKSIDGSTKSFDLSRTGLTKIDLKISSISKDPIEILNFSFNQIKSINSGVFDDLSSIKELKLNNNKLEAITAETFTGLLLTQNLLLNGNCISSIDSNSFCNLNSLVELDLNNNCLASIDPQTFSTLTNLKELSLGYNSLKFIDPRTFNGLNSLEVLYLNNNHLTKLNPKTFNDLKSLKELYLNHNKIASLETGLFNEITGLQLLRLDFNEISSVNHKVFNGLVNLKTLYLFNNQNLPIDASLFCRISNLQETKSNLDCVAWKVDGHEQYFKKLSEKKWGEFESGKLVFEFDFISRNDDNVYLKKIGWVMYLRLNSDSIIYGENPYNLDKYLYSGTWVFGVNIGEEKYSLDSLSILKNLSIDKDKKSSSYIKLKSVAWKADEYDIYFKQVSGSRWSEFEDGEHKFDFELLRVNGDDVYLKKIGYDLYLKLDTEKITFGTNPYELNKHLYDGSWTLIADADT